MVVAQDERTARTIGFISAIREDRECVPSFADGLRAQGVADAILTAVDERRWVECSPSSVGA